MTDKQYQAKRWLSRCYELNREIKILEDQLEVIRQRVNNAVGRYEASEVQTSRGRGLREDLIGEVIELEDRIQSRLTELLAEDNLTSEAINEVDNSVIRAILTARYVNRYSWTKIERLYNYSHAHIMRIHLQGLDSIEIKGG